MARPIRKTAEQIQEGRYTLMSMLDEQYEAFHIIDKTTEKDSYGSLVTVWKQGAEIVAIAQEQNSTEAQIAMALSEKKIYTIITKRDVVLWHDDVIQRDSDGICFRVISDAEKKTPASATLDMRRCDAEPIILPTPIVIPEIGGN